MDFKTIVEISDRFGISKHAAEGLFASVPLEHARVRISHKRRADFDEKRGLWIMKAVDEDEVSENTILNVGRVQYHKQCFGTSGLATNGMNYIALSNDATSPAAGDTTLAAEISTNGLARAQGSVTLASGSGNQTTIDHTFTATGAQSCQKAALFDASSVGNMNHELLFTQRSLVNTDTIDITYTITLG